MKKNLLMTACVVAVLLCGARSIFAQDDKLTYVLTRAEIDSDAQNCRNANHDPVSNPCHNIEVLFGKSFPSDVSAQNVNNWLALSIDINGKITRYTPVSVTVDRINKLVKLDLGQNVNLNAGGNADPKSNKIMVRYREQNYPIVTLGQPKKDGAKKAFTAAKGKSDADIYFSGVATAQRHSGPLYSIEAKVGYLQSLGRGGALGMKGTFLSDSKSDIDPDSITITGSYQKIFVFAPSTGIILNSDFLGGEFDKKNKTRNLMSEIDGTLVLPSARFRKNNFATMDLMSGFEGGHNYKNAMNPKGLGNIWRPKLGVNAYFVALHPPLFNRITFNTEYILRLPRTSEPFTEKINGSNVTSLTRRPRHYIGMDLGLLFAPSYGFTVKYRYGALPPDFKLVDQKVSAGFVLQLKQANK